MDDSSITGVLQRLQTGDDRAAAVIWERYFQKLVRLAAHRLRSIPRRAADEEDVALSAMNSFWQGMQDQRFIELANRDELWKLLVTITIRKSNALQRRHFTQNRGSGDVRGESVFERPGTEGAADHPGLADQADDEPTPELAAEFSENVDQLLGLLDKGNLRDVAVLRLEGHSNAEIAERLNKSIGTIERKLGLIRDVWSKWLEKQEQLSS